MRSIPLFPEFMPFSADMKNELHPFFTNLTDGISEFTFSSLLIHQKQFHYEIARVFLPINEKPFYIIRVVNPCPFFYLPEIKGIYQFINCAAASTLPESVQYIREQDLDDSGLRQEKETYRPEQFIKKYKAQMI